MKLAAAPRITFFWCTLALLTNLAFAAGQTPIPSGKSRTRKTTPTPASATSVSGPMTAATASDPESSAVIDSSSTEGGASPAGTPPSPANTETEITATQGATFTSKDRIAVFTGDVRVHDPKFQLGADELTVYLAKAAEKLASGATPAATPPPLAGAIPAPSPAEKSGGGIDHAIAKGHVIIIQERPGVAGSETKRSVGRCDEAFFDNKTGDMVLKGSPSVEQNGNSHVATSPSTVMTLRRDNSLVTVGPSRTLITQRKGNDSLLGAGSSSTPAAR